jgi:diguanylate cyclase (GGDEF)-like protein
LRVHQLNDGERRRALEDGLTGLHNRRAFDQELKLAVGRADRRNGTFALLMLDLDHFKKLNDTYGHPAGDAALKRTAATLKRLLRRGDVAARYGGEEFVMILDDSTEAGACTTAERVREAIKCDAFTFEGAQLEVTASLGLALWPADGRSEEALVASADRALYAAKEGGRDRLVAASSLPAPAVAPLAPE